MARKTVKTATQATANWQSRMQDVSTAQNYAAGIDRYTGNPMQAAAQPAAMQLFLTKITQSVTSGRRAARLNASPRDLWANNAKTIGVQNLQTGATKGAPKYNVQATKWQSIWQQASDAAASVPKQPGFANAAARWGASTKVMMSAAGTA